MQKIVVIVQEVHRKSELVACIHQVTGLSVSAILGSFSRGKPLGSWFLFGNDHGESARILRGLQAIATKGDGAFGYYELQDDEQYDERTLQSLAISTDTLTNILEAHDVRRQKIDE